MQVWKTMKLCGPKGHKHGNEQKRLLDDSYCHKRLRPRKARCRCQYRAYWKRYHRTPDIPECTFPQLRFIASIFRTLLIQSMQADLTGFLMKISLARC